MAGINRLVKVRGFIYSLTKQILTMSSLPFHNEEICFGECGKNVVGIMFSGQRLFTKSI